MIFEGNIPSKLQSSARLDEMYVWWCRPAVC